MQVRRQSILSQDDQEHVQEQDRQAHLHQRSQMDAERREALREQNNAQHRERRNQENDDSANHIALHTVHDHSRLAPLRTHTLQQLIDSGQLQTWADNFVRAATPEWNKCSVCHEQWIDMPMQNETTCKRCHRDSGPIKRVGVANNMVPATTGYPTIDINKLTNQQQQLMERYSVPAQLVELTFFERLFIQRINVSMYVCRLKGGQIAC